MIKAAYLKQPQFILQWNVALFEDFDMFLFQKARAFGQAQRVSS